MSTPTTNLALNKPTVGGNANTWGTLTNTNWDTLDTLFAKYRLTGYKQVSGGGVFPVASSIDVAAGNGYIYFDGDAAQYIVGFSYSAANNAGEQIRTAVTLSEMTDRTTGAEKGIYAIYTKPSSGAAAERMRVLDTGEVCIGRTSTLSNFLMAVDNTSNAYLATGGTGTCFRGDTTANGSYFGQWLANGAEIGSIKNVSNTSTSYNTTSDKRLKTNAQPLQNAGNIIDAIAPVTYEWKYVDGVQGVGFLAQDLAKVIPETVSKGDDNEALTPQDEGFQTWGVDLAKIVPYLVAELQELRKRVATLEA